MYTLHPDDGDHLSVLTQDWLSLWLLRKDCNVDNACFCFFANLFIGIEIL